VVAAPDQALPALVDGVDVLRDPVEGHGPLQGIAVALEALAKRADYAYVTSTDAPFLAPAFVRRMRELAEGHDACVVRDGGHHHPLSAVFATRLWTDARALLDADRRRPFFLFEGCDTRFVERDELLADPALRQADPDLWTLRNLNTPEDYETALRDAGLAPPDPDAGTGGEPPE
jgi:molybdopterin-guanine dinucleotide biosynthesis protein A